MLIGIWYLKVVWVWVICGCGLKLMRLWCFLEFFGCLIWRWRIFFICVIIMDSGFGRVVLIKICLMELSWFEIGICVLCLVCLMWWRIVVVLMNIRWCILYGLCLLVDFGNCGGCLVMLCWFKMMLLWSEIFLMDVYCWYGWLICIILSCNMLRNFWIIYLFW